MIGRHLSKSRIQSGRQCHKRLWLELHEPEASQWTPAAQARLDEGTRFGDLARDLLGGGVLIAADHRHVNEALAETVALLALPREQAPMLFEPAFSHEGVRVRVDAFQRHDDGDTLIEVKSTTSVKPEHLWDCAIQTWVARGTGRNVSRIVHGHVDRAFVYETEGDYRGLLKLVDVTSEVEALVPRIPDIVEALKQVAAGPLPLLQTGGHCSEPYECPFLAHCRAAEPPGPAFPVDLLPRSRDLAGRLVEAGYVDLCDVPDDALGNPVHRRVAAATRSGEAFVSGELQGLLADIAYPRAYLDFETISFVVPRWLGTRPFQQLPFQFSCHTESSDGSFRHDAFLDVSGRSPLRDLVDAIVKVTAGAQAVLVWNKGFEGARLRELAGMFPAHAADLRGIVDRMVDLLPIYRRHYYHRDMRGSWSIKAVLPTIAPDLDYADLGVADGGAAQSAYLEACAPGTHEDDRERLRTQLLAYCARDTWAMVRLEHAFDMVSAAPDFPREHQPVPTP
ncbi:DUF2779 domain-containing protein [Luteimonas sp. MC1572]|uniref:DUF2779 domain-containing protein n=1 Tax=Luteimonas sp. MC1572 TaxID=2799325 RepID=UPI0018F09D93|nr:DUF2779 domain-containing protein [Luteimonas sp. MC1572]MBJ6980342.1 DUF2779 domain-containing protein [Luteimonas sp. MC1572]QQO04228.1 DUF2779 domain-containing protein [Luteimonas sp. MC1572]